VTNQTKYKIEKHVPRDTNRTHQRYPFKVMKVGDSFMIPKSDMTGSTRSSLFGSAKYQHMKISVRQMENGGLRVWRVK